MMTEWENQPQPPPANPLLQPSKQFGESGYSAGSHDGAASGGGGGGVTGALYVKVMTDEQLEVLRNQIAVYASICEQLVEMHKAVAAQQDLNGARLGNLYCDPLVTSMGHKIMARQRWTPTPVQLQLLEQIFEQGAGTPSKQKIKRITTELSQHGHISETNVYNWFQNRRARSKRKQLNSASNNAESEVETDADSPKDKKTNPENFLQEHDSEAAGEDYCYQGQEMSSEIHSSGPQSNKEPSQTQSLGQLAFYESMMEHSRMDHFIGKIEVPGCYNPYQPEEDYRMTG